MSENANRSEQHDPLDELTFEEALRRIEEIVQELESGRIGLDDAIVRYELGVRLIKHCRQILTRAERRVRLLVGEDEEGNAILTEFAEESVSASSAEEFEDPPAESPAEPARGRRRRKKRTAKAESDNSSLFDEPGGSQEVPF